MKGVFWRGLGAAGLLWAAVVHADGARSEQERAMLQQARKAYAAQGLELGPEQEEQFLQRLRQVQGNVIQAQIIGQSAGTDTQAGALTALSALNTTLGSRQPTTPAAPSVIPAAPMQSPVAAAPGPSQQRPLAEVLKERRTHVGPASFESLQDGFSANGHTVIDPEGRIVQFGGDATTGDVTYFVEQGAGSYLVRFNNVHSSLPPATVGSLEATDNGMRFISNEGKRVAGQAVVPTGHGVVVVREGTVFDYTLGADVTAQPLPETYQLASLQQGDVASTGYVLLRRQITEQEKTDPIKGMGQLLRSVAGRGDDRDYALFNIRTAHTVYLNRDESMEKVGHGTDCHAKNAFVNKCRGWESKEALYDQDGLPNHSHYYWSVYWMQTNEGPTAVVMENGVREINVIRLDSGQRVNAFKRTLGIQKVVATPTSDGSIRVAAAWAFKNHVVEDVRTLFEAEPAS